MANRVTTIFDAVDRGLSDAVGRIKASIASADTATGKFKAGWSGLVSEFNNSREAQVAVATGAVAIGVASVKAASDLGESMNAVDVTFSKAAEGIHKLGEDSANSYGMSERAFNQFATQFSAFAGKIAGESGQSIVTVVDEMTTRIADFASVHNLSMEEAAQVAQSTLAGETEAFRRYGGDVSAATVTTYAYEKGIAKAGEELTEQQKIMARYGLFMEQTNTTAGDFKNTQDSLANAMRTAQAHLENLAAGFGGYLTPAVADSISTLNDFATALKATDTEIEQITGVDLAGWFKKATDNFDPLKVVPREFQRIKSHVEDVGKALDVGSRELDAFAVAQKSMDVAIADTIPTIDEYDGAADRAAARVARFAEETVSAVDSQQIIREEVKETTEKVDAQAEALIDLRNEMTRSADGVLDLHDAEDDLADKIAAAKDEMVNEERTMRSVRDANEEVVRSASNLADQQLINAGLSRETDAGMRLWTESMLASAATMDGPMKQATLDHITRVTGIPTDILTSFGVIVDPGALAALEDLLARLGRIANNPFARVAVGGTQGGARIDGPDTGADGNYNTRGGATLINEGNGGELVTLPGGSKVMTHANSQNYMRQMGGDDAAPMVVNNKTINQFIQVTGDAESVLYEAARRARYME